MPREDLPVKLGSGFNLSRAHSRALRFANCRYDDPSRKWPWWKKVRSLSLHQFLSDYLDFAFEWQASLPVAVIALVKTRGKKIKSLLFDGRLWAKKAAASERPAILGWLLENEKLKREFTDLAQIPPFHCRRRQRDAEQERLSLCEWLGKPAGSFSDPQNLYDLRQCLNAFGGREGGVTVVTGGDRDVCFSNGRQFVVEAKTDSRFVIFYQDPLYRPVRPLREPLEMENEERQNRDEEEDVFQTNRSSATSVRLSGLNLAFSLGVISRQEFGELSKRLGETSASLALHLDGGGHLRHIFYRDASQSFGQMVACFEVESEEDCRRDEAVRNMNDFWNKVWTRRRDWGVPARSGILQDVIARLERLAGSPHSSLFGKCLQDLKKCVTLQHVVFFSSSENQVHSVKYFLANYTCKVLKLQRGLQLRTNSDNDINALVVSGQLSLFNLQTYAKATEDAEFYGEKRWIPPPAIDHSVQNLHKKPVYSEIVSRARMIVFSNLEFWTKFGRESVASFGVDLHGNGTAFRSASLLAFESVWSRFVQLGGPLVQGPEKIKNCYAKMLRSASRGGFMFSAQKLVEGGEGRSIMNFDISSAYGFSASNALMPSGFCTGFVSLRDEGGTGPFFLDKTDPVRRHKTFEFKAVYFTLKTLMSLRSDIRTVFSNFSPSGLFYLDKYPADLAVAFSNGQVQVFQFDGHFVHGCDVCPLSSRARFVNNQTHEQVRWKTKQRDRVFGDWVSAVNAAAAASDASPRAEYFVISDCHSEGYSSWSLDMAFETDPVLQQLVSSYETVCGNSGLSKKRSFEGGREATLASWLDFMKREKENKSFTCIAWLKGFCPPASAPGCLITYPSRRGGCALTNSVADEPVVLIRDYYDYLVSHQGFVVTDLEAVLFFKAEPIFNQIYRELTERRHLSRDQNEKNWIKRLVNLSCGFFGLHRSEATNGPGHRRFSIRCRIPRTFNISSHRIAFQGRVPCLDNSQYYIMSFSSSGRRRLPANNALALFFTVVEMGKLRLVQALQFISRHVPPQRWSLLYSNVDNLIVALEGASCLDEAVVGDYAKYLTEKLEFVAANSNEAKPGQLKLEWLCNSSSWKFITARLQQYVLREEEEENVVNSSSGDLVRRQKTSGLTNLTNEGAFDLARSLLFGDDDVTVGQERRINKLQSMMTQHQTIVVSRRHRRHQRDT